MPVAERRGAGAGGLALEPAQRATLAARIDTALARARRDRRRALAAITVPVPASLDPSALALGARRADDDCFCLEQPDRDRFALVGLGAAATIAAGGETRFEEALRSCRTLAQRAFADDPAEDPGRPAQAGPVWLGGFAFANDGGATPEWKSFDPIRLVMPEVALARAGDEVRLTVAVVVDGDESQAALMEHVDRRLGELIPAELPLADPDPIERARVASAAPPAHYEGAVARAVERIRAGELEKLVLAREVRVHDSRAISDAAVLGALRSLFPSCYAYLVATPEAAFLGASPELLVRREGARAQTVALAGTAARSADPAVDRHLGERLLRSDKEREEHAIVARRIERTLEPTSVWVTVADEPSLVRVAGIQHLATPIRAQLARPLSALELARRLHPTPAIGGEPRDVAVRLIPELEGLDRGWYAGGVGWMDLADDGEFCVAIRCALVRGSVAHLYAGNGIVRDSNPQDELAETEVKLGALLPLLT